MSFGITKAAETLAEMLQAHMQSQVDGISSIESPIERIFYVALTNYAHLFIHEHVISEMRHFNQDRDIAPNYLYVDWQYTRLDWPVDFFFAVLGDDRSAHFLAVECDGHDFHERTREQAARDRSRDRALQADGVTVMRFTGSEIYRDPIRCVVEVMTWAKSRMWSAA